ncbi:membrane protein [Thermopolyspora flexuosa]|uniref:Putative hemolysin n=1 Tax=Thermopolyspora flexuosa TaxID=103836 RepID=A0A543J2A0_9ACTN|nr:hemolysin family protein [Thermopolyspora flexuosa]TQM76956.1 putative hemolysin [Thermopolyspora flexuosa]GGM88155.1 membrane protein [Thermopolyspora flexuosa]
MGTVAANIALVLLFILIGGFFAAAEIALVSLRESQVRRLAERGRRGARVARLARDPNRFLSSVQIGVTVATMLSAAFGADTLARDLAPALAARGVPEAVAAPLALVLVTLAISYVSLVLGELAPKRLALQRSASLALVVAPVIDRIAVLSRPVIWLLSKSTDGVVRLLGGNPAADRSAVTVEELRDMVVGSQVLTPDERRLIGEVFAAGKRQVREVLLPRTEVEFMDADTPFAQAAARAAASPHSRFPVFRGSHDNVIGFVHIRDLLNPALRGHDEPLGELVPVRPVKFVPASKMVLAALSEMRDEGHHLAIVVDEYGGTSGIVTLEDLVEELIGDIRDEYDRTAAPVRRVSGELDLDGLVNLDGFAAETGMRLPDGPYETLGGFIMAALGRVPQTGDEVRIGGYLLTVTEMDGRRVARVRVSPYAPGAAVPGLAGPPGTAEPAPPDGDDGGPSPPRGGGGVESQNASGT